MKVYVLTALLVTNEGSGNIKIELETHVFEDEKRCLLNIGANQARLEEAYYKVRMQCMPKNIIPKSDR
jgi:hypothetical protein